MSTLFADLGLPARLVEALAADGMTEAFPVQAITLPDALAGKDLCGRAPTGSGKTLGFGIPMMVRISQAEPTKPTGLVLVPTRELAEQVQRAFVPLGRAQWRFIQAIYGGASFGPQIHSLRKGASVVVATPGRLIDIIEKGYSDLSAVEVCVIDEADRMADLGFMPDVRKILDMTPKTRQTMLWSATLDGDVNEIIRDYMNDPVRHDLMDDVEEAPVDHKFVVTRPTDRLDSAVALIEEYGPTIVFVKTRFGVDDVSEDLNRAGVKAGALHGARSQAVRQRVLEDFKRGKLQALVATDVAARGIHVDNVSLVLHYDMPDNDKDYTHRSGRTGRAGQAGVVIAFVPPSRQRLAEKMSDAVGNEVTWERGEKPVERVPASERETGNRDRGDRERSGRSDDRGGYRGNNDRPSHSDRSTYGERSNRNFADRSNYSDRADRPAASVDRPSYADRSNRTSDRPGTSRPSYSDRAGASHSTSSDRNTSDGYRGNDSRSDAPRDDRAGYSTDRGHNNWTPRPPRADTPVRDGNDWTPRPRRDDDRGTSGGRFGRDDRSSSSNRPGTGPRPSGDRPGYQGSNPRPERAPFNRDATRSDRPAYGGRPGSSDRPAYGGRPSSSDRPAYGGRPGSSDRPSYGGRPSSSDRPSYGGRPSSGDRPSYGGRPSPGARPGAGGRSSGDRPGYQGSNPRPERAPFNRDAPRNDRPSFGDRPSYGAKPQGDKPWQRRDGGSTGGYKGRDERPSTGGYKGRDERPSTGGYKGPGSKPPFGAARPYGAGAKPGAGAGKSSGFKPGAARPGAIKGGFRAAPGGRARRDQD